MHSSLVVPYAPVLIKLLQNPLFSDDTSTWNMLLLHQHFIQEHFARMGLELQVYETDGFAFLHQPELEDEEGHLLPLPRLTRRDRLALYPSLLCVVLREWLDRFERETLTPDRCLITLKHMREMLVPFLPHQTDERILLQRTEQAVGRLVDIGILKRVELLDETPAFEVRRIIKARVSAEQLVEMKERMEHYGSDEA